MAAGWLVIQEQIRRDKERQDREDQESREAEETARRRRMAANCLQFGNPNPPAAAFTSVAMAPAWITTSSGSSFDVSVPQGWSNQ